MNLHRSILSLVSLISLTASLEAAMLKQAEVTAVINEVKLVEPGKGERPAGVKDVVAGSSSIKTGIKSRAELLFQDKTLTRLGANTLFSFDEGTRDLELEHGTMLLQAPKGIGGARIRTAAVTAAITGTTILLEYSPAVWKVSRPPGVSALVAAMTPEQCALELDHPTRKYSAPDLVEIKRKAMIAKKAAGHVKVMVLEGTLRLYLNNRMGESVLIGPGQMVVLSPNATTIPPGVNFDIARLAESSLLVNNKYWGGTTSELGMALVTREIQEQEKLKEMGDLTGTGLKILGTGTNLIISDDLLAQIDRSQTANNAGAGSTPPGSSPQNPPVANHGFANPPGNSPPPAAMTTSFSGFTVEGSSTPTNTDAPTTSTATTGNVTTPSKLNDTVPILPTEGNNFLLVSSGGATDTDGLVPRSASKLVRKFDFASLAASDKRFLTFDYRFLSNETDQPGSFADELQVKVDDGTKSILYTLDRDALSPGGNGVLTPIAQAHVGGFAAGTDWLSVSLDISPFAGSMPTISFLVYDRGDPVVDSAVALDRIKVSNSAPVLITPALPGKLTLTLDAVTFGPGDTEVPNLEGLPARGGIGVSADVGSFTVNTTNDLIVNSSINASTGANGAGTAFGGKGGAVALNSAAGEVAVNSTIKVSESAANGKASASGGSIKIISGRTSGAAITINNTGELLSLLDAMAPGTGGSIQLSSAGGTIHVNGGKLTADRGTIDVRNNGATGLVQLTAAQLAADIVKVGALGDNGVLRIGGGSIDAATTIHLYAGGSNGTVDFVDNVTLSGASLKTIAGNTVNITNGKVVTVNGGAATVYTNNPNYTGSGGNGSKTGTFGGTGGASTLPFNNVNKPAF